MTILFLDFDGVVHPEPCYDASLHFCFLWRIEAVLEDFQDLQIVISSTWRESRSLQQLKEIFESKYQHRVIGVTPSWKDIPQVLDVVGYQRQAEIEGWLRASNEPWRPWVAVDDKPYLFKPFLSSLVKTNPVTGYDETTDRRLREKLKSKN